MLGKPCLRMAGFSTKILCLSNGTFLCSGCAHRKIFPLPYSSERLSFTSEIVGYYHTSYSLHRVGQRSAEGRGFTRLSSPVIKSQSTLCRGSWVYSIEYSSYKESINALPRVVGLLDCVLQFRESINALPRVVGGYSIEYSSLESLSTLCRGSWVHSIVYSSLESLSTLCRGFTRLSTPVISQGKSSLVRAMYKKMY
jgi:hypothetical protein